MGGAFGAPPARSRLSGIAPLRSLGATGSYVLAARTAGYTYASLVNRIVEVAWQRCLKRIMGVTKDATGIPCDPVRAAVPVRLEPASPGSVN